MAKKKEEAKPPATDPYAQYGPSPEEIQAMMAGTIQKRAPIGAPEEFYTPGYQERQLEGERLPPGFEPWRDGDEAMPGTWGRNEKARLQAMLNAAGLYAGKAYRAGDWGRDDATALKEVLEFANYQGIDNINEAVRRYAETATTESLAGRAPRAPLVVSAANPEAVRQTVRATALNLMGRRLSDAEEARLVQGFIAQDTGAQQAQYGAGAAGGSFTEPLTAEQYATSQLEGTAEAGDQRYLDGFEKILKSATSTMVQGPTLTGQGGVQ